MLKGSFQQGARSKFAVGGGPTSKGLALVKPWIIERLDRKLADATGSNIVEKCDVMFSRAIQPLTSESDVLRILFFIAYFIYTGCPCFEVKDEEELLLEKIV